MSRCSGDAPCLFSSCRGGRVLANASLPQPACDGGCGRQGFGLTRPPPPEKKRAPVSASAEAQREPLGGLSGCLPRRPSFGGRSRSAQGQGRPRWRVCLCSRCMCGASPHTNPPSCAVTQPVPLLDACRPRRWSRRSASCSTATARWLPQLPWPRGRSSRTPTAGKAIDIDLIEAASR